MPKKFDIFLFIKFINTIIAKRKYMKQTFIITGSKFLNKIYNRRNTKM
jgi:hypothetical protein